jgi:hypothetical protein
VSALGLLDPLTMADLFVPDDLRAAVLLFVVTVAGLDLGLVMIMRAGREVGRTGGGDPE